MLFEEADLFNARPIDMKPGNDHELGPYLCPNCLQVEGAANFQQA